MSVEFLSPEKFESFQVEMMSDSLLARKCLKCPHGLHYSPAISDENCHKCAREREEKKDK